MAGEGIGSVICPELHLQRAIANRLARAVVNISLAPTKNIGSRHLKPFPLGDDLAHLLFVFCLFAPDLCLLHRHCDCLGCLGVLLDPICPHRKCLLWVVFPQFTRNQSGVAKFLGNKLGVPGFPNAECLHCAHLHVCHHLGRRNNNQRHILIGVNAACCQPVAHPQVVGATGEGHGKLQIFATSFCLGKGIFQGFAIGAYFQIGVILGDRNCLPVGV